MQRNYCCQQWMGSLASNWQKLLIEEPVSVQHPGPRSRRHKRNSVCSGFRHDLYLTPQMNFSSLLPCSRPHLVIGCIKIIPYNKNPSIPGVAVRWLRRDSGSAAAICHGAPAPARPQSAARSTTSNWPLRNLYSLSHVILFQFVWWNNPQGQSFNCGLCKDQPSI